MSAEIEVEPATGRGRKIGILLLIALVVGGGLYLFGYMQGKARYAKPYEESKADAGACHDDLTACRARSALMQARVSLYGAASELDRRNFGTASERVQEAARALRDLPADAALASDPAVVSLRNDIAALKISVAEDLESQRSRLLDLAAQLGTVAGSRSPSP